MFDSLVKINLVPNVLRHKVNLVTVLPSEDDFSYHGNSLFIVRPRFLSKIIALFLGTWLDSVAEKLYQIMCIISHLPLVKKALVNYIFLDKDTTRHF